MDCIQIQNFIELHEIIEGLKKSFVVYRGVGKESHDLRPKVGRYKHVRKNTTREQNEIKMLDIFIERASPFLRSFSQSRLEWLAIAQHHGMPTRLLDWTTNPLCAAYFAVENEKYQSENALIYAYSNPKNLVADIQADPFQINEVLLYRPKQITPRLTAQNGLFTIHPEPEKSVNFKNIIKIIIDSSFRTDLKYLLYKYGIHRAALFPDLDGISNYIEWVCTTKKST